MNWIELVCQKDRVMLLFDDSVALHYDFYA